MRQEVRLKSALAMGTALLVSAAAGTCTKFNFDVDAVPTSTEDPYNNPYPNYAGPNFWVSPMVNCTAELAQSQAGGGNGSTCGFHRYPMGLIVFSEVRSNTYTSPDSMYSDLLPLDLATREHIFSLVRAANPRNITTTDFNVTIVMNYTTNPVDEPDFLVGETGSYRFNPQKICYNGTLSGCDDRGNDSSSDYGLVEGTRIQACGYEWIDEKQPHLPTGQQRYKGYVSLFPPIRPDNKTDPQPTYAESAGNASVNQIDKPPGDSTSGDGDDDGNEGSAGDNDTSEAWMKSANLLALVALVGLTMVDNYL